MQLVLEGLGSFGLFLLQIDNFPLLQHVTLVALVTFGKSADRETQMLGDVLETVVGPGVHIIGLVVHVDGVAQSILVIGVARDESVGRLAVILVEFVGRYHPYQFLCILGIGGLAAAFQSVGPSFIVADGEFEERLVTLACHQKT